MAFLTGVDRRGKAHRGSISSPSSKAVFACFVSPRPCAAVPTLKHILACELPVRRGLPPGPRGRPWRPPSQSLNFPAAIDLLPRRRTLFLQRPPRAVPPSSSSALRIRVPCVFVAPGPEGLVTLCFLCLPWGSPRRFVRSLGVASDLTRIRPPASRSTASETGYPECSGIWAAILPSPTSRSGT